MQIKYGSVCSGIEAATVAWHPLGWRAAWYAEIEPFPSAVLAHHYPGTPNHGDMTRLAGMVLAGKIPAPEVLVGGTPCQAFSVAGMREGLADPRGALTIKYVELLDAIDHVRHLRGEPEAVCLWENVPGVLSDKGNAFGCFLGALVGESEELQPPGGKWKDAGCVYGPTRTVAWRILDAQYFGLAQRRKRVFVVASARAGFDPLEVLFEREGVRRDTPPRRGEGQDLAGRAPFGPALQCGCGWVFDVGLGQYGCPNCEGDEGPAVEVLAGVPAYGGHSLQGDVNQAATLTAKDTRLDIESETFCVAPTLDASFGRLQGCSGQDANHGHGHLVVRGPSISSPVCITGEITHALKAEGFDASEDGTGRGQPIINHQERSDACAQEAYAIAALRELRKSAGEKAFAQWGSGVLDSLQSEEVLQSWLYGQGLREQACDFKSFMDDGSLPCPKDLPAGAMHRLWESGPDGCTSQGRQLAKQLSRELGKAVPELPLEGTQVQSGATVRRLTPVECERLMGFPDNHTRTPYRGKPADQCPDGPRYKAIGNSKAVFVVRWIGWRIQQKLERIA